MWYYKMNFRQFLILFFGVLLADLLWPSMGYTTTCYEIYTDKHGVRRQRKITCDGTAKPQPAGRDKRVK